MDTRAKTAKVLLDKNCETLAWPALPLATAQKVRSKLAHAQSFCLKIMASMPITRPIRRKASRGAWSGSAGRGYVCTSASRRGSPEACGYASRADRSPAVQVVPAGRAVAAGGDGERKRVCRWREALAGPPAPDWCSCDAGCVPTDLELYGHCEKRGRRQENVAYVDTLEHV